MGKEQSSYIPAFPKDDLRVTMGGVNEVTREFILECIENGTITIVPEEIRSEGEFDRKDQWDRYVAITLEYYFTDRSYKEIGDTYHITRQGTQDAVKRTLGYLWDNANQTVRSTYPLEEILEHMGKNHAESHGYYMQDVIQGLLDQGVYGQAILDALNMKIGNYTALRGRLLDIGIEIPTLFADSKFDHEKLAQQLQKARDEDVPALLERVDRGFYTSYSHGPDAAILPVRSIVPGDYHIRNNDIHDVYIILEQHGIPVGFIEHSTNSRGKKITQRYYFIAAIHKEKAQSVLLSHISEMEQFRTPVVIIIAGPSVDAMPKTTMLVDPVHYAHISSLLREHGLHIRGRGAWKMEDIFDESTPAPIFKSSNGIFYRVGDYNRLNEYLRERINHLKK